MLLNWNKISIFFLQLINKQLLDEVAQNIVIVIGEQAINCLPKPKAERGK